MNYTDNEAEKQNYITQISKLGDESMENMNEIIWGLKNEYNTLEEMQIYLRQYVNNFAEKNKQEIDFQNLLQDDQKEISTTSRRFAFTFIKEILVSKTKNKIIVTLSRLNENLILDIQGDENFVKSIDENTRLRLLNKALECKAILAFNEANRVVVSVPF